MKKTPASSRPGFLFLAGFVCPVVYPELGLPLGQPFVLWPDRFPVPLVFGRRRVQHRIDHVAEATVQIVSLAHGITLQGWFHMASIL